MWKDEQFKRCAIPFIMEEGYYFVLLVGKARKAANGELNGLETQIKSDFLSFIA